MLSETLVAVDAVFRAAYRPEQHHLVAGLRVGERKGESRRAAHAATHNAGPLEAQVIQKALCLARKIQPGHALDPPSRAAAFAPVEGNAREMPGQMIQRLGLGIDAQG